MNLDKKFMKEIGHIKEPEIMIGVARILRVELVEKVPVEGGDTFQIAARPFVDVFEDIMRAYHNEKSTRRAELYEILRAANRARGGV